MGLLVEGQWKDQWYDTRATGGRFVRQESAFRNRVDPDQNGRFPAAADRYHLYVSLACPWAHRTLIARHLKGLTGIIPVSVVDPYMAKQGWSFTLTHVDPLYGKEHLHQIYTLARPDYTGRVTVPVLWDRQAETIVNNESSEILRIFNRSFDRWGNPEVDLYPEELQPEIDEINTEIYDRINNGVYKCGFATDQAVYEENLHRLFEGLDRLEERLSRQRYLTGNRLTEADIRLFTTLVRFDPVYVGHFKCNIRRIIDYPNLWEYLRDLYQTDGFGDTVDFDHIKQHYYRSHDTINPTGIVPLGPEIDFSAPHRRHRLV